MTAESSHAEFVRQLDRLCDLFERSCRRRQPLPIEDLLPLVPASGQSRLLEELLPLEIEFRQKAGLAVSQADYENRFDSHREILASVFSEMGLNVDRDGRTPVCPEQETIGSDGIAGSEEFLEIGIQPRQPSLSHLRDYEILGEIGRGGMGVVFRARHKKLGRLVALKMILGGELVDAQHQSRFANEAAAVAALRHPHIVQIFEVAFDQQPAFMALELVDGPSLAERLKTGPVSFADAAAWLEACARALHVVHAHGIVHRDIKPGNILLDSDNSPKITDFGLAKRLEFDSDLTQTGAVLGTPGYMAPEQAEGGAKLAVPATDVYALGATLYHCLTGNPPFRGTSPADTLRQVLEKEPVAPRQIVPQIPRDLDTICLKCLEKNPAKRYLSAEALAEDLARWRNREPIQARPTPWLERAAKWCRRRPSTAALIAVSLIGLIVLAGGGGYFAAELKNRNDTIKAGQTKAVQLAEAAKSAEVEAQAQTTLANELGGFVEQVLGSTNPLDFGAYAVGRANENSDPRGNILANAESELLRMSNPRMQAYLLNKVCLSYLNLGDVANGKRVLAKVVSIRLQNQLSASTDPLGFGEQLHNEGLLALLEGDAPRAETELEEAVRVKHQAGEISRASIVDSQMFLAVAYLMNGKAKLTLECFENCAAALRVQLESMSPDLTKERIKTTDKLLAVLALRSILYLNVYNAEPDDGAARQYVELAEKNRGSAVVKIVERYSAAWTLRKAYDASRQLPLAGSLLDGAEAEFRATIKLCEEYLGPEHYLLMFPILHLADMLADAGKFSDAEPLYRRNLALVQKYQPADSPLVSTAHYGVARSIWRGRVRSIASHLEDGTPNPEYTVSVDEATAHVRRSVDLDSAGWWDQPNEKAIHLYLLGYIQLFRRDREPSADTADVLLKAWRIRLELFGPDDLVTGESLSIALLALARRGDNDAFKELESCFREHQARASANARWDEASCRRLVGLAERMLERQRPDLAREFVGVAVAAGFPREELANELAELSGANQGP